MKLTDKTKKQIILAGLGIVSIALVIAIASQFKAEVPRDAEILATPAVSREVTPSVSVPPSSAETTNAPTVSAKPIEPTETPAVIEGANTGKSTGTEQSIQAEPIKPPVPTDPPKSKTEPSSPPKETVTKEPSKAAEHKTEDKVKTTTQAPTNGEKKDGKIYVPGFGWIEDEGGGVEQKTVGNEGDQLTGNKLGSMD